MPYVHCHNCHHEWESPFSVEEILAGKDTCTWCEATGQHHILEKETPLEKMLSTMNLDMEALDEVLPERKK